MDDLYRLLSSSNHVSVVNAALLLIVFFLAKQRYAGIVEDFECLKKSAREHERTFLKNGMEIERET
jgi:hypothetical protein